MASFAPMKRRSMSVGSRTREAVLRQAGSPVGESRNEPEPPTAAPKSGSGPGAFRDILVEPRQAREDLSVQDERRCDLQRADPLPTPCGHAGLLREGLRTNTWEESDISVASTSVGSTATAKVRQKVPAAPVWAAEEEEDRGQALVEELLECMRGELQDFGRSMHQAVFQLKEQARSDAQLLWQHLATDAAQFRQGLERDVRQTMDRDFAKLLEEVWKVDLTKVVFEIRKLACGMDLSELLREVRLACSSATSAPTEFLQRKVDVDTPHIIAELQKCKREVLDELRNHPGLVDNSQQLQPRRASATRCRGEDALFEPRSRRSPVEVDLSPVLQELRNGSLQADLSSVLAELNKVKTELQILSTPKETRPGYAEVLAEVQELRSDIDAASLVKEVRKVRTEAEASRAQLVAAIRDARRCSKGNACSACASSANISEALGGMVNFVTEELRKVREVDIAGVAGMVREVRYEVAGALREGGSRTDFSEVLAEVRRSGGAATAGLSSPDAILNGVQALEARLLLEVQACGAQAAGWEAELRRARGALQGGIQVVVEAEPPLAAVLAEIQRLRTEVNANLDQSAILTEIRKLRSEADFPAVIVEVRKVKTEVDFSPVLEELKRVKVGADVAQAAASAVVAAAMLELKGSTEAGLVAVAEGLKQMQAECPAGGSAAARAGMESSFSQLMKEVQVVKDIIESQIVTALNFDRVDARLLEVIQEIRGVSAGVVASMEPVDFSPVLEELQGIQTKDGFEEVLREIREQLPTNVFALCKAQMDEHSGNVMAAIGPLSEEMKCLQEAVNPSPVLGALAKIGPSLLEDINKMLSTLDFELVLKAIREEVPAFIADTWTWRAEGERSSMIAAVAPLMEEVAALREGMDFGPVLIAIRENSAPILEELRKGTPEVDLAPVLEAIYQSRAQLDFAPILEELKSFQALADLPQAVELLSERQCGVDFSPLLDEFIRSLREEVRTMRAQSDLHLSMTLKAVGERRNEAESQDILGEIHKLGSNVNAISDIFHGDCCTILEQVRHALAKLDLSTLLNVIEDVRNAIPFIFEEVRRIRTQEANSWLEQPAAIAEFQRMKSETDLYRAVVNEIQHGKAEEHGVALEGMASAVVQVLEEIRAMKAVLDMHMKQPVVASEEVVVEGLRVTMREDIPGMLCDSWKLHSKDLLEEIKGMRPDVDLDGVCAGIREDIHRFFDTWQSRSQDLWDSIADKRLEMDVDNVRAVIREDMPGVLSSTWRVLCESILEEMKRTKRELGFDGMHTIVGEMPAMLSGIGNVDGQDTSEQMSIVPPYPAGEGLGTAISQIVGMLAEARKLHYQDRADNLGVALEPLGDVVRDLKQAVDFTPLLGAIADLGTAILQEVRNGRHGVDLTPILKAIREDVPAGDVSAILSEIQKLRSGIKGLADSFCEDLSMVLDEVRATRAARTP